MNQTITVTLRDEVLKTAFGVPPEEPVRVIIKDAGPPGPPGPPGSGAVDLEARAAAQAAQDAILAHQNASQPHKAYDQDLPDLTLIFQNGLI